MIPTPARGVRLPPRILGRLNYPPAFPLFGTQRTSVPTPWTSAIGGKADILRSLVKYAMTISGGTLMSESIMIMWEDRLSHFSLSD
jgi:hypothetical protein